MHIPNEYFPFLIQPVLRILFGGDHNANASRTLWTDRHDFVNLSITPVGCSLTCPSDLVSKYLTPLAEQFNRLVGKSEAEATIEITKEEYVAIQVEGQGIDAGQRVLELTGPLAMAGM